MTCTTCPKRNKCTELCAEAEKFVSQDDRGNDVLTNRHYFSFSIATNIDYSELIKDIEERKKDELVYYFQKIQNMPDSIEKIIVGLIFFGIPVDRIAYHIKKPERTIYYLLEKLQK